MTFHMNAAALFDDGQLICQVDAVEIQQRQPGSESFYQSPHMWEKSPNSLRNVRRGLDGGFEH